VEELRKRPIQGVLVIKNINKNISLPIAIGTPFLLLYSSFYPSERKKAVGQ
jgi:hypothetical protein